MIEVRRGADRFRTVAPGIDSRHSFSYGPHYDPDNLGFGVLMAHNEDRLSPGSGFDRHPHRGLDIVTWVLSGTLEHEHWTDAHRPDLAPTSRERVGAGSVQVLRTGSGVQHAERAPAREVAVHYLQMWLASATPSADPGYDHRDFTAALAAAATTERPGWVTVASGRADLPAGSAVALSQPGAELSVARLPAGAEIELPAGLLVHVFIARGAASVASNPTPGADIADGSFAGVPTPRGVSGVDGTQLAAGDALRLRAAPATALVTVAPSEVLALTCSTYGGL